MSGWVKLPSAEDAVEPFPEAFLHPQDIYTRACRKYPKNAGKVGWVYFASAIGTDFVKIGFTTQQPRLRLREIQVGCPHEIEMSKAVPAFQFSEQCYHQAFWRSHVRGEWFTLSKDLVRYMDAIPGCPTDVECAKLAERFSRFAIEQLCESIPFASKVLTRCAMLIPDQEARYCFTEMMRESGLPEIVAACERNGICENTVWFHFLIECVTAFSPHCACCLEPSNG